MRRPSVTPLGEGAWRIDLQWLDGVEEPHTATDSSDVTPFDRDAIPTAAPLHALVPGAHDLIITDQWACVYFDPDSPPDIDRILAACRGARAARGREIVVQVRYDGPDLAEAATLAGLAPEALVALHTARPWPVRFLGFLPGFAYLGPAPPGLDLARRATPRPRVAAGSVGLAGGYTAVYPFASPGGWHLIGTAIDFQPFDRHHGAALRLGDRVRFVAVAGGA